MVKSTEQQRGDQNDNTRVFRWGIGAVLVLIAVVLIFNAFFHDVGGTTTAKSTNVRQATPDPVGNPVPK